ncbi:hypothetical protein GCM10009422_27180 [Brevundimonas kwangchunensis]|uniref:Lipoprotein n=1 Tax=Brevundimonas kwangchunensis TaxID=322163 RepID=A0ABN1H422_9CAUL
MIRSLTLTGVMLTALAAGACNTVFEPIQPEVSSPMGRMDRAEGERQRASRNHPDCYVEPRTGSREDQRRRREGCQRAERNL